VSRPVRIAIVGTGDIAQTHARALAGLPHAELAAAMDSDDRRLDPFCSAFGTDGYRDLGTLLTRAGPDLVHVCTPPAAHYATALVCLHAGASVLVEKPPVISLREFDGLTAAQGPRDRPPWFATVFQHRFGSGQRRLKHLMRTGVLGRPLLAVCHTTWFRDQAYFDVPWRGNFDTEGGGPTMGHGIHQMDMLLDVLGDWAEVSALARTQARDVATEDVSLAHVTFASGAVASVVNSVLSPREESYLRFDFEHATVEVTHLYGYDDADWRVTPAPGHEGLITATSGEPGVKSGHQAQFARVIDAIRHGNRPPVAPGESRRTLALAAGIYASAFTRRPVTPGELEPGSPFYGAMNGGRRAPWLPA